MQIVDYDVSAEDRATQRCDLSAVEIHGLAACLAKLRGRLQPQAPASQWPNAGKPRGPGQRPGDYDDTSRFLRINAIGNNQDGRMTRSHLLALLGDLPEGVTEIYAHPATASGTDPRRLPTEELAALVDPSVRALVAAQDIALTSYAALAESSRRGTAGL